MAAAACHSEVRPPDAPEVATLTVDRVHSEALSDVLAIFGIDSSRALVLSHREATVDLLDIASDTQVRIARKGSGPRELRFPIAFAPERGARLPRVVDLGRRGLISLDSSLRDRPFPTSVDARTDIVPLLSQIPIAAASEADRYQLFKPDSALIYPRSFRRALILAVDGERIGDTVVRFAPDDSATPVIGTYVADQPLACVTSQADLYVLDPVARAVRSFRSGNEGPSRVVEERLLRPNGAMLSTEERLNYLRHVTRRGLISAGMPAHDSTIERPMRDAERDGSLDLLVGALRPLVAAIVCDQDGDYVLLERFEVARESAGNSGVWVKLDLQGLAPPTLLQAPRDIRILSAAGRYIWGLRRDENDLEQLIRMRLPSTTAEAAVVRSRPTPTATAGTP